MLASPRAALVVLLLLGTLSFAAPAVAGPFDCVRIWSATFADSLQVLIGTGRSLAVGLASGDPADGMQLIAIFTPSECTGLGVGLGGNANGPLPIDADSTWLPLP